MKQSSALIALGMMMAAYGSFSVSQYHSLLFQYQFALNSQTIGWIFCSGAMAFVLAPPILRYLNRFEIPIKFILALCYLIISSLLIIMPRLSTTWSLVLAYVLYIFFSQIAVAYLASSILGLFGTNKADGRFMIIRSAGTMAFAATCFLNSFLAKFWDFKQLYLVFGFEAALGFILSLAMPNTTKQSKQEIPLQNWSLRNNSWVWPLLICVTIANMGAYTGSVYTGNLIRNLFHGTNADVSQAWFIATSVEVPTLWLTAWCLERYKSMKWIFVLGISFAGLKIGISSIATELWQVKAAQVFHGLFLGGTLSCVPILLKRQIPAPFLPSATLLSSSITLGLGNALGGLISGYLWQWIGLKFCFALWSIAALICALWIYFDPLENKQCS